MSLRASFYIYFVIFFLTMSPQARSQGTSLSTNLKNIQLKESQIDYTQTSLQSDSQLQQTKWLAQHIRVQTVENTIPGLHFEQDKYAIFLVRDGQKFRPLVSLKGYLKDFKVGSQLILENRFNVPVNEKTGYFVVNIYLTSKKNEINLVLRQKDKQFAEKSFLVAPDAQEYNVTSPWDSVRVSLGTTYLYYSQTGYSSFYSWIGDFALRYHSPEKVGYFGFSSDLDLSLVTFKSNQNNYAPQVGQFRFEMIYFDNWENQPQYNLHYLLGGSYLTMLSNGASFGFKNLLAPDLGLRIRKVTGPKTDVAATLRLSLMDTQFKDRGVELELSAGFILNNSHRAELGLKYLDYAYSPDKSIDQVKLKTTTFFVSYTL